MFKAIAFIDQHIFNYVATDFVVSLQQALANLFQDTS